MIVIDIVQGGVGTLQIADMTIIQHLKLRQITVRHQVPDVATTHHQIEVKNQKVNTKNLLIGGHLPPHRHRFQMKSVIGKILIPTFFVENHHLSFCCCT